MNETQASMDMHDTIYWHQNQVAFTFHSPLEYSVGKRHIIASLPLDQANQLLQDQHQLVIRSFTAQDVMSTASGQHRLFGAADAGENPADDSSNQHGLKVHDLYSPVGKFVFPAPGGSGTSVIAFFHIEPVQTGDALVASLDVLSSANVADTDYTVDVVKAINTAPSSFALTAAVQTGLPPAMPNWLGGGTGQTTHGCPASPPMPVPIPALNGRWPIELPELSEALQGKKGDGVTILVLDALPTPEQIQYAAEVANPSPDQVQNALLRDMASGLKNSWPFNAVPPAINVYYLNLPQVLDNEDPPMTGKDLYKNIVPFRMPDHGMFVTGMIRDLAPHARIECIRVLNDFGVCSVCILIQALEAIHERMRTGDLHNQPVVINLSLSIGPYDSMYPKLGFDTSMSDALRIGLHTIIKSLTDLGAVIVAAAGNGSHTLTMPVRMGPRYPAAYPEVVSVTAVMGDEEESVPYYSDRATAEGQPNGIATYGGSVARPIPPPTGTVTPPPPIAPEPTSCMTGADDIDAPIGVYTSTDYPKLAKDDCQPTYATPVTSSWAYWSGTSFATPIISAVAARILQDKAPGTKLTSADIIGEINAAAVTPLPHNAELGDVSVLRAIQRKPEAVLADVSRALEPTSIAD